MSEDDDPKRYGGADGSHRHWPIDEERVRRNREAYDKAQAERRAKVTADRKKKRDDDKALARQEGQFIGPPNPFLYRTGRPPMKVGQ